MARSRAYDRPRSILLPVALTLTTAAIASAGLYFFSDSTSPPNSFPASDSEDDRRRPIRPRRPPRRNSQHIHHDHITEEDTDAIEEGRVEEELFRKKKREGGMLAYMKGAAVSAMSKVGDSEYYDEDAENLDQRHLEQLQDHQHQQQREVIDSTIAQVSGSATLPQPAPQQPPATVAPIPPLPPPIVPTPTSTTETKTEKYIPPKRIRPIAIVLSERKALQGHESDDDFDEALLPSRSILTQLPPSINLPNATLHILIHSPHLTTHPLSTPSNPTKFPSSSSGGASLSVAAPDTMPSPSLGPLRLEDSSKSTFDLATDLVSRLSLPRENILPYTQEESVIGMLRAIGPVVVYFEESLLSAEVVGEILKGGAVGTVVIVLGGGDDDVAGLVSSDDEAAVERKRGRGKWWEEGGEVRMRFGRRVEVVEGWVLAEDWMRRVEEVAE